MAWLTCSGRITHIVVTRRLQAEHRTGSVHRPKTGVLPTVLRNQKPVCDFLLVLIELFSLGRTAEALRTKIDRKSATSLQRGHVDPKFLHGQLGQ